MLAVALRPPMPCAPAISARTSESATSKGGVYFHFPSKQALFLALLSAVITAVYVWVQTPMFHQVCYGSMVLYLTYSCLRNFDRGC